MIQTTRHHDPLILSELTHHSKQHTCLQNTTTTDVSDDSVDVEDYVDSDED